MEDAGINLFELTRIHQIRFDDYALSYEERLQNYLGEFIDNNEYVFIKLERILWDKNIKDLREFVISLSDDTDSYQAKQILEIFKNRINTVQKINLFLNRREKELDNIENCKNKSSDRQVESLKSLFLDPTKYNSVVGLLESKKIILCTDGGTEVVVPLEYKRKGNKAFVCAIGLNLKLKGYLKNCNNVDLINSLNQLFCNIQITKQNYDSFLKSTRQQEFLQYTSFL